jgi:type IV secretion system protein VirD4
MGVRVRLGCLAVGLVLGLTAATQFVAARYQYQPALGWGLLIGETAKLYPPWDILIWAKKWAQSDVHGPVIRTGAAMIMFGLAAGAIAIRLFDGDGGLGRAGEHADLPLQAKSRRRGWGDPKALVRAGLASGQGVVLGRLSTPGWMDQVIAPRLLTSADMRPALVTGGTRSGKGRGIVVPTLLNWDWSVLAFDPKGELWTLTAGHRATLGPALFFNPLHPATARFNPLAEIPTGPHAIPEVQKLVAILTEPGGQASAPDFWDRQGAEMLGALILHTLYTADPADKTLVGVKRLTADLDETARAMVTTLHLPADEKGPARPEPFIADIASAYLNAHEKGRKSVQMTVRSYLGWIAGAEIEQALSASDFRLSDLMCARAPVSLYVQIAPAELKALQPLVRLFFHLASTTLTTHITTDSDGRPKENALLMALDEFPLLGKVSFFEDVVRLSAGYGIKRLFVAQSLNDVARIYGQHNGFLDNAHVYVAFAALDPLTREKVSKLTGVVRDVRRSASLPHHFTGHGGSRTIAEVERALLDPAEVGALDDDEQLVFIAGHRPYRLSKVKFDHVHWMAARAALVAPDQRLKIQTPERPAHPWAEVTPAGYGDPQSAQTAEEKLEARRAQALAEQQARDAETRQAAAAEARARKRRERQPELDLTASAPPMPEREPEPETSTDPDHDDIDTSLIDGLWGEAAESADRTAPNARALLDTLREEVD